LALSADKNAKALPPPKNPHNHNNHTHTLTHDIEHEKQPQFKAVKPVGDRVLVKVDEEETRTVGGVLLPSAAQSKPTAGKVVAMGDADTLSLGDRVVYSKYAGTEVEVGGKGHVLLKEEDVIGVLTGTGDDADSVAALKPLGDRVLIRQAAAEDKTSGGVLLTAEASEKPTFGTVVAVGPGRKAEEGADGKEAPPPTAPAVDVGATVMYSKYAGTEFDEDDAKYIVVRESDVLAALS